MKTLPVLEIDADQVGPLGLTVGRPADLGGARDPKPIFIPLLNLKPFDERQDCDPVHDFVFYETPPDLAACPAFVAGPGHYCRRMGKGTPCAFFDAPEAAQAVFRKARVWKRVETDDGFAMLHDPDDQTPDFGPLPQGEGVEL